MATPGAKDALDAVGSTGMEYVRRHMAGDWGEVPPEDARSNDFAATHPDRMLMILSAYTLPDSTTIWIITDGDRHHTTLLLPDEY